MRRLKKAGKGRAAVVVPHGALFGDGVAARIKADMIEKYNLHTIVRLPEGVFSPYADIPSNIIFFDTKGTTKDIWYYELPMPPDRRRYSKTKPLTYEEFEPCLAWWGSRTENERSWIVSGCDLIQRDNEGKVIGCNLDIKNPHIAENMEHRSSLELACSLINSEREIASIANCIKVLLAELA